MIFPYTKCAVEPSEAHPERSTVLRPVIPITLINEGKSVNYRALIDSGADFCIFHIKMGEIIGLDIEKGRKEPFSGVRKKISYAYFHDIILKVGGAKHECYAGFSADIEDLPYGIIGQKGFFDIYKVNFDLQGRCIEVIRKYKPRKDK